MIWVLLLLFSVRRLLKKKTNIGFKMFLHHVTKQQQQHQPKNKQNNKNKLSWSMWGSKSRTNCCDASVKRKVKLPFSSLPNRILRATVYFGKNEGVAVHKTSFYHNRCWKRELSLKCKLKCYVKLLKDPLGVNLSKGNQGTTREKKFFWPRWESNPRPPN